ncbi:PepSY domain-containing protein [Aquimarina sp. 2201CG1-2-11]|uniref:PepSY domain-containing protein n=1 Tax=Aquimarina discodermiae TaxID=3231043 RepID=UPI003461996D
MKTKQIHTIHHYLGTFFFGMFLIWFLSGFVMMYKSFPFLSQKEKIEGNEIIQKMANDLPHPAIVFTGHQQESTNSLRINSILDEPVYHLITNEGKFVSKFAYTGENIKIDKQFAIQVARTFTGILANAKVSILTEVDQWIPRPKYAKHLPVYKVNFEDEESTYVHISSKTGEVISNTTRFDRVWAWLGAIPHWIYLKEIRMHATLWSQLCIWLSAFGFIMCLSGIITGIVRFKNKPKANFKRFKNKWYNFHYYTGLIFGVFVCTWIFSGFMSMSPFNWSYNFTLSEQESLLWEGRKNSLENITDKEWANFQQSIPSSTIKEAHFSSFSGKLFAKYFVVDNIKTVCLSDVNYIPKESDLSKQISHISKTDMGVTIEVLHQYDNYYYDRHNNKKIPVIKATTTDLAYYIDPVNGNVLLKSDVTNKLERWLYHGLHSWDFSFLTSNRPLWDIVMILLLLGGTTISITATGLGIKFIKRKRRKYLRKKH